MTFTEQDITESLKQYFGFEFFKGEQRSIVKSVLDKKNTFVITFSYFLAVHKKGQESCP